MITKRLADKTIETVGCRGSDKFRIEIFYVIIDKLVSELEKQSNACDYITQLFGFLCNILDSDLNEIRSCATKLVEVYPNDLYEDLISEFEHFISLLKLQKNVFLSNQTDENFEKTDIKILNWIVDCEMIDRFPNIYIAYRIFITIPLANYESERSFSVLKRIKNVYRSTMLDERLSSLTRLAIETDLLKTLDYEDVIKHFSEVKSRTKYFT